LEDTGIDVSYRRGMIVKECGVGMRLKIIYKPIVKYVKYIKYI